MDSIIEEIIKINSEEKKDIPESVLTFKTWLIFSVNEDIFAIESYKAKEVLRNMEIYPLPFVPEFIKGVLNRHGSPYTVVDLSVFLGGKKQDSLLFIVLNLPDSQFCIQVCDVLDFHTLEEKDVILIEESQEIPFFSGTINYKGKKVPILEIEKIYEKIKFDFERKSN